MSKVSLLTLRLQDFSDWLRTRARTTKTAHELE
jgi:hypothetical protein